MVRLFLFLAATALADVAFNAGPIFLKTDLSGPRLDRIQFALCPIDHPDVSSGKCLRLSTCAYRDVDLERAAAKLPDKIVRNEIQSSTRMSLESKLPAEAFSTTLLKIMPGLDGGRGCVLADPRVVHEYLNRGARTRSTAPSQGHH